VIFHSETAAPRKRLKGRVEEEDFVDEFEQFEGKLFYLGSSEFKAGAAIERCPHVKAFPRGKTLSGPSAACKSITELSRKISIFSN
jgi:hypothetical protein